MTTLELDAQVTEDEKVVVTHDRQVNGVKCQDTEPAFPGDPEFPYVGDFITNLTLAQVKAAKPAEEWEGRMGGDPSWTTDMFVEAVYKGLTTPAGKK